MSDPDRADLKRMIHRLSALDPDWEILPVGIQREIAQAVLGKEAMEDALGRSEKRGFLERKLYDLIQGKMNPDYASEPECEREFHYREAIKYHRSE